MDKTRYIYYQDEQGNLNKVDEAQSSQYEKLHPNDYVRISFNGQNKGLPIRNKQRFFDDYADEVQYTQYDDNLNPIGGLYVNEKTQDLNKKQRREQEFLRTSYMAGDVDALKAAKQMNEQQQESLRANDELSRKEKKQEKRALKDEQHAINQHLYGSEEANAARMEAADALDAKADKYKDLSNANAQAGKGVFGRFLEDMSGEFRPTTAEEMKSKATTKESDYFNMAAMNEKAASRVMKANSAYDKTTGMGNFVQGAGHTLGSKEFWTLYDEASMMDIRRIIQKMDEGKTTTAGEDALLESYMDLMTAQAARSEDMSKAYKSGQMAAESVPFMAEMFLTKGLGTAVKKSTQEAVEALIKKSLKKEALGKAGQKVASFVGHEASNVARAIVAPSTYGAIADEAVKINEDGSLSYGDMQSAARGLFSGIAEIASEESGEAIQQGFGWLLGKTFGQGAKNIYNNIRKSGLGKVVSTAGFNGMVGEMAEEWYRTGLDAVAGLVTNDYLGDKEAFKEFATAEQQLVMLGGFAPMSAIGVGANLAGLAEAKNNYNKSLQGLQKIQEQYGLYDGDIDTITSYLDEGKQVEAVREMFKILKQGVTNRDLSNEEAQELYTDIANIAMANARLQVNDDAVKELQGIMGPTTDVYNNYILASNNPAAIEDNLYDSNEDYMAKRQAAIDMGFKAEEIDATDAMSMASTAVSLQQQGNTEASATLLELAKSKATIQGMEDVWDVIRNNQTEIVQNNIARFTNEDGMVRPMIMDGRMVYITDDRITFDDNGIPSDAEYDNQLVEVTLEDGSKQVVSYNEMKNNLMRPIAPDMLADSRIKQVNQELDDMWNAAINTKSARAKARDIEPYKGKAVYFVNEEGKTVAATIKSLTSDGKVVISGKKGELGAFNTTIDAGVLYDSLVRDANGNVVIDESKSQEAPANKAQTTANDAQEDAQKDVQNPQEIEKNANTFEVGDMVQADNVSGIVTAISNGIATIEYRDELGQLHSMEAGINTLSSPKTQNADTAADTKKTDIPIKRDKSGKPIRDDNGDTQIDWDQYWNTTTDVATYIADFREQSGYSNEVIRDFFESKLKQKTAELKKESESKSSDLNAFAEKGKKLRKIGQEVAKYQQAVDILTPQQEPAQEPVQETVQEQEVAETQPVEGNQGVTMQTEPLPTSESTAQSSQSQDVAQKSSQKKRRALRYAKEDAELGEYIDFRDYVMRAIATGTAKFIWSDSKSGTKGLGKHLGLNQSNEERNKRIWLLSNESGSYPEIVAQNLLAGFAAEALNPQADPYEATGMTDMDALDVILDVLQSYSSPRAMFDAVRERHQKNKDPYYDMTEEEYEARSREMSVDEWIGYQEAIDKLIEDLANNITEEEYNRIFAENESYGQERTTDSLQQGISEGQGPQGGNAQGDSLLQEEESDKAGGYPSSTGQGLGRNENDRSESSDDVSAGYDEQPADKQIEDQETKLPTLTEQQILSLDIDEDVATMAIAYLNGNNNPLCESAYIALQEYVQNEILSSAGNSADGNSPLMAGESNGTSSNLVGGSGQSDRRLDRGNDKSDVSESGQSGQNGTGGLLVPNGEGSGSSLGVGESDVADSAGSQRSRGRDRRSSTGSNVRERGRHSNSDGVSSKDGKRRAETQSDGVRADDLINEGLEEIKNLLSGAGVQKNRLYSIGGAAAQGGMLTIKLISAGAKVGYGLVLKGFHQFKKWKEAMFSYLGPVFSANSAFSDDYIDKFIDDMWEAPITRDGETHTIQEWASIMEQKELRNAVRMSLEEKRKLQAEREGVETIIGDIGNIRESLPFLMPAQQEDVEKAEKQFFDESHKDRAHGYGKGILFTNGTGTGKTYTGLGIVKRFVKQGKGRVLIVTAQDQKIQDWIRDAKNLGIEATQLADTKSKGAGVVVTQFANMRQNRALLEDEFDLIVYDESHKLMENKDGSMTTACVFHHQLSNKDVEQAARRMLREHPIFKKELELLEEISKINDILKKTSDKVTREESEKIQSIGGPGNANIYIANLQNQINLLKEEQNKVIVAKLSDSEFLEEAKRAVDKTKVVFLSASPFNTAKNLDYVEGYIFSYNPEAERYEGGENLPSEDREKIRDKFVLKTFPSSHDKLSNGEVRMRSESQIANPQKSSDEEIAFTDGLINQGSLSGRVLDSEYDYSREFPRLDFPLAQEFNKLYQSIQPNKKYAMLAEVFKDFFDKYDKYTAFFEAIKAEFAIERIKEHLALGRKVVVFHRRRSSQDDSGNGIGTPLTDCIEKFLSDSDFRYKFELMNFVNEFRDFLSWERSANLDFPHYKIAEAFATEEEKQAYAADLEKWQKKVQEAVLKGKKIPAKPVIRTKRVQVFNGAETEANKRAAVRNFNDDNSGCDIFVAQVASAKEGIDAHDTTGKHQRVEVNLYLPQSPLEFMQAEGRIYRIGNKSNAVIEYPLLGIDFELASFAYKINGRSQTSENLAMGSQSRGLRDSIARAALSSKAIPVSANQGIGGKMLDKRDFYKQDNFNDAINNYNEWKASQSEDYTQKMIPDPIGERMVAWAMTESGDTVYIPNAGEGSVARYIPQNCRLVAQEEDVAKYSKLVTLCGGGGRKILNEDYHEHINRSNDVILSFLPNMSDEKERDNNSIAAFRLNDSGRMIAVTTAGSVRLPNYGVHRARIILPLSAMGIDKTLRGHLVNGTSLEIHIIDVLNNKELRERAQKEVLNVDLSHITSEEELWKALKEIVVPSRIIDNIAKVKKRVDKVLDVVKGSPFVRKEKDYRSGKMVPAISTYDNGMDIKLKRGYLSIYYGHITPGNKDYNFDYVERLARQWVQRNREIENYEDSTEKYGQEIAESAKIAAQIIESALGKTPSQIRNIADGINENAVMGKLDIDAYKDIVNSFINNDASLTALSEKVMSMAEMFGITSEVANDNSPQFNTKSSSIAAYFSLNEGKVWIRNSFVNSLRITNERKGQVMLHEMIHAVTSYALNMYEMGMIKEGTPLFDACRDIYEVYDAIKEDPTFTQYIKGESGREAANNEYGTSSVHEMIAELSNPAFRLALKAKKLWRQLINGVKRLLGINITGDATEMNALVALEDALDRLLDNIDKDVYEQQKNAIMQFAKENNMDYYLAKEVTDPALIDKFNSELQQQIDGTLPKGHIYQLGMPSEVLRSAGVENLPIELAASRLTDKSMQENHPFDLSEVENLPEAIHNPLAVFISATKIGSNVILTELKHGGRNFVAILHVKPNKKRIEVNQIRSLYPKNTNGIIDWINNGLATYMDKGRMTDWIKKQRNELLSKPQSNSVEVRGQLVSATKIIEDFENPILSSENIRLRSRKTFYDGISADELYDALNEWSDYSNGAANLFSALENHYGGTIVSASNGAKHAIENGLVPVPSGQYDGLNEEYHHIEFIDSEGESFVEAVPFVKASDAERYDIRFRHEANSATGAVKDGLIIDRLTPIAQRLGLKVRFVKRKDMPKAYMNDKGFYNTSTEEIIICPENHDSLNDAYSTLLHEGVAHHGLRALMGDSFDEFLDRVYNALPPTKRLVLAREAREKYGHLSNPLQVATEEYLATLAENMDFNKSEQTLWDKIKAVFNDIMRKLFGNEDYTISDGDLRYILQASYNHLNDPRGGRTLQGWAKDRRLREKAHSNDGNNIRRREGAPSSSDIAKTLYENEVSSRWNKFQQEFQDGQQAVRVGIKAIQEETGGKRITDSEDYITKQNHKSSIDSAQVKAYVRDYYEPIDKELKAISNILIKERGYNDNNDNRGEVYDILMQYLISKHGLERDAYYNNEHAKEEGYKPHEWSGLSSLFQCEWEKATERAQELVQEIEEQVGEEAINALWEKINKANEYTLRHNRDSGLITKEQYEKASKMFKYYIPLRGFSEKTAEEEYFNSYGRNNRYSPYLVTKSTKGRKSLADNPIATMMWMTENAISQGNKNLVKQAFYRFVQNRPNSLITEADTWYVIEDGELVASYPDIREGMTQEEIKSAYNEFYKKMRALAKEGKAFKEGDTPKLPFRMVNPRHKNDHLIVVRVAGKDRTLIVHGDPALAKAVNGIMPETGEFEKAVRKTSRIISSTYTTYSVDFIARNMIRDMIYSNISAATRDHFEGRTDLSAEEKKHLNNEFDVAFKKAYMVNMVPGRMMKLLAALRNGTLNMSESLEREFAEFIANGGQTGYSQIDSVDKHKRELERRMKRCKQGRDENVLEIIGGTIELLNEGAELMSRFAAYRAGRKVGMSIQQSVAEAKEISVNFNRRGEQSGKGFFGGVARYLGLYKYFFNAGVQGSQNFIKLAKTAPLAMSVRVLSWVAWGGLMPLINSVLSDLFGGDEDEYWNLPEYVRQNNICLGWGKHFFMIPLPIEMRAIYSVGDIIASLVLDKRLKKDVGTVALDIVSRVLSVFPVNPIENVAGVDDVVSALGKYVFPDIAQPVLQAFNNENFAGQPIYKNNPWDKGKPYFMRVYAGGPRWLTRLSEGMYRASFNGKRGIDFNPEIVDHLLSGYFGGLYGLIKNLSYTTEDVIKGNATLNDVPIARTLIKKVRDESFYTSTYWECKDVLESSFSSFKAMEPKATKELLYGDDVPQQWKNKYNMFQKGHYNAMKAFYHGSKELEKKEKKLKDWKEKAKEGKNIPQEKMDALEAEIILDRRELIDNVLRLY